MMSVVLLELTTEYTEYTEEENLTEYRRFAAYGISQKESMYGIRDANFLGISVRFSSLYATKRFILVFSGIFLKIVWGLSGEWAG